MENEERGAKYLMLGAFMFFPAVILVPIQFAVEDVAWSVAIAIMGGLILLVQIALIVRGFQLLHRSR